MERLLLYATQLMETGGIESHVLEFCEKMAEDGVKIDLIVPNFAMQPQDELRIRSSCNQVRLYRGKRGIWRFVWLFFNASILSTRNYDALYTNGQGGSIGIIARLIRREHWVHHHHTAGDAADQATWSKNYFKTLCVANSVIACSYRNANDMNKVIKRSINVIPCFSRKIDVQPTLSKRHNKIRFGYYGRLIPEKGIDIICKLSEDSDLNDVEFHLWGVGSLYPASFFEKFSNVNYHGTFSKTEELVDVIKSIDGFILLSTHPEGLPICLLEAMSAGLPWLATDRGGITDIACDPISTRVIPSSSNYSQIKAAVLSFAVDLRAGRISKAMQLNLYEQKFSSSSLVSQWRKELGLRKLITI